MHLCYSRDHQGKLLNPLDLNVCARVNAPPVSSFSVHLQLFFVVPFSTFITTFSFCITFALICRAIFCTNATTFE